LDGVTDNRGFTGHEMLDQLDLVHMNGRVYDPLTARFLSGDPLIQNAMNGQNYNRYSYVLNNPTNLTDPTGFECTGSRLCQDGDKAVGASVTCEGACGTGDQKNSSQSTSTPAAKGTKISASGTNVVSNKNPDSAISSGYVYAKAAQATGQINGCDAGMQCVVIPGQKLEITKDQRDYLNKGDYISFWQSRNLYSHDPVAKTALSGWAPQLLNKPTMWQKTSSKFTWTVLRVNLEVNAYLDGTSIDIDATMQHIGLDLARAHAAAVDVDLRDQIGVPGLLSPQQVANYHWDVFSKYGVSKGAFGGTLGKLPASSYPVTWCEGCDGNKN
jgi:RHS repeat-associated protein